MLLAMEHFRNPAASLEAMDAVRRKLLPNNTVPLEAVINNLKSMDLIL